ncbi:carbamoyltransferase HypF [Microbulbifer yueqingensis]|uniref:Carbamoyltransferase HypF n=1 Tax=Microbulbifer yueqingensis TaxID=658219 RepID=A0A1G8ZSF7_9GAMM|nr:carbamoyltransferase HypF [Microbulbifer yueqingensis]SDK18062.1 hydrogenase maturation protein HypF [Microbulbifer yueqingensis]
MTTERLRIEIGGLVQGVGFRPFVYRLANDCGLHGWVANDSRGVQLEVQGSPSGIREFMHRLTRESPARARITSLGSKPAPVKPAKGFSIRTSRGGEAAAAILLPDLAPCDECLREMADPANRRFRYPFINCTQCGPRFSIVSKLPYDRANTTMAGYVLCPECRQEYTDPLDRRFHAEPIACPVCGPRLMLRDTRGNRLATGDEALQRAADAVRDGGILALKGVGGFQLLVDAASSPSIERLRRRKRRPEKPFAVLYSDIGLVERECHVSPLERTLLCGAERPIVLLARRTGSEAGVAGNVAPGNPNLGVMLPGSPLHQLLMSMLQRPAVCTSGNLSGEPLCSDDTDAITRLGGIADIFLTHDRRISNSLDDSVVREVDGGPLLLRRARGYVPAPVELPPEAPAVDLVAVGADLKNCPAIARGRRVFLAQHIGDLDNRRGLDAFEQTIARLRESSASPDDKLVCDLHPGYVSRRWVLKQGARATGVQHHVAHFFSCMAEHGYSGPALGICWDGTGFGSDGTLRGSEFLQWDGASTVKHICCLREFPLPGGEAAIREPRRQAAALLFALPDGQGALREFLQSNFSAQEGRNLSRILGKEELAPRCSSGGRLFDAVAALLGLCQVTSFEGQAAMAVEHAAQGSASGRCYPFALTAGANGRVLDWSPMVNALLEDQRRGITTGERAAAFHNTLARMMLAVAEAAGIDNVFLSGGVFQNRRLAETTSALLRGRGFMVHSHRLVPPNDGGIALGQIYYTRCMERCGSDAAEGRSVCV